MTYTPNNQVVLLNQPLNADFNVTGATKNTPHIVTWDQDNNCLLYINTVTGDVEKVLFGDALTYACETDTGAAVPTSTLSAISNKCHVIVPPGRYTIDFNGQLSATGAANNCNIGIYYNTDVLLTGAEPSDVAIIPYTNISVAKWPTGAKWPISILSGIEVFTQPVIIKAEWIDPSDQGLFTMNYRRIRAIKTFSL